jgi:mycofactocin precursor peptide peptidase
VRAESRAVLAWLPRWLGDAHAGRTETSLQLALAPGRVRLDRDE